MTSKPILVGFTGRAGVGKSTCANILKSILVGKHIFPVQILPFAAPLKKFATELGWNGKKDEKGRRLLQLLGTDCGRDCISPDIWVTKWTIQCHAYDVAVIIADDVRFDNEASAIRNNGIVIEVQRDVDILPCGGSEHRSEQPISPEKVDYVIHNAGSEGDLYYVLEGILKDVQNKRSTLLPNDVRFDD